MPEANKEAVDFLFSLLSLPLGKVVQLLTKESMVGCLGNLYNNIESLDQTYVAYNANKTMLLNPKTAANNTLFLTQAESSTQIVRKYYICYFHNGGTNCKNYVTDTYDSPCLNCGQKMQIDMKLVRTTTVAETAGSVGTGFVKEVVTYTVMDYLTVTAMSTISSITMLNKFQVKDIGSLVEKHVELEIKQGLKLLKASLQSKTVLTNVFLSSRYNLVSRSMMKSSRICWGIVLFCLSEYFVGILYYGKLGMLN